jgi:hypothetical protein
MRLLKKIRWALAKSKLEQNLARYCELEYRPADKTWALQQFLREHKQNYFGE